MLAESFLTIVVISTLGYLAFELWGLYHMSKNPTPPFRDEGVVLEKIAKVVQDFSDSVNNCPRNGAIELHGTLWNAESAASAGPLKVGDFVKVIRRDGLTLLVERIAED